MICHPLVVAPFTMFLINDGYDYEVGDATVYFSKPTKQQIKISINGKMNNAGKERYALFLKIWLKRGKEFIEKLVAEYRLMVNRL